MAYCSCFDLVRASDCWRLSLLGVNTDLHSRNVEGRIHALRFMDGDIPTRWVIDDAAKRELSESSGGYGTIHLVAFYAIGSPSSSLPSSSQMVLSIT